MKQYYSKVWKYYLNKNKILLYIIKSTTLACICLATWKHNDNFLCSENYYSTTTILDIAPIDVIIGQKLLLQYLSLIMKQYNSKVWKYYLNMNRILLWIMKNTTIACICLATRGNTMIIFYAMKIYYYGIYSATTILDIAICWCCVWRLGSVGCRLSSLFDITSQWLECT
jgi:hypothetical protein